MGEFVSAKDARIAIMDHVNKTYWAEYADVD